MSRLRTLAFWVFLLAAVLPGAALAQATLERAQTEIERTEPLVERARGVVAGAGNAEALAELERAVELQTGARAAVAQNHPRIAIDMTQRARAGAERAIAMVSGLPDPDRAQDQLKRTREMIDDAAPRVEQCNLDRARVSLRMAQEMQRRAEDSGRGGHYLAALQLTMGARERVQRSLRQCRLPNDTSDKAERALRRTDEAISRAQEIVGERGSQNARALLSRAIELQARAQQEFRDQHPEAGARLTLSARALAVRASRVAGRGR